VSPNILVQLVCWEAAAQRGRSSSGGAAAEEEAWASAQVGAAGGAVQADVRAPVPEWRAVLWRGRGAQVRHMRGALGRQRAGVAEAPAEAVGLKIEKRVPLLVTARCE
jgi:hypothetical protein